jgi:hypothetical protein
MPPPELTDYEFRDIFHQLRDIDGIVVNDKTNFSGKLGSKQITISNSRFLRSLKIDNLNVESQLIFQGCTFGMSDEDEFVSTNLHGRRIEFRDCVFWGNVKFVKFITEELWFYGCIFWGDLRFSGIGEGMEIYLRDLFGKHVNVNKNLIFENSSKCKFSTRGVFVGKEMNFHRNHDCDIYIGNGSYNTIRIENLKDNINLKIQGDSDDKTGLLIISLIGVLMECKGTLLFKNAIIWAFEISPYNSNSNLEFKIMNIKLRRTFSMIDSDLGKILFNQVDFSDAFIEFDNSNLGSCVFSNIEWPEKHRLYKKIEEEESQKEKEDIEIQNKEERDRKASGKKQSNEEINVKYEKDDALRLKRIKRKKIRREVYRQLKNVMKAQSSNIDALEFYRNEMREYWFEIKLNPKVSFWEKFIVGTSKWTSDFGVSLKRPLQLLMLFHLGFFLLLILCHYDGLRIDLGESFNRLEIFKGIGDFLFLLNPIHKMPEGQIGLIVTIDFFIRLFSGFFIYHIISATRKHIRL